MLIWANVSAHDRAFWLHKLIAATLYAGYG
jgi:hypothetical protein